MIALWMLYAVAVALALCAAAAAAERGLRLTGRPARGVWAGALAGTIGLPAAAYLVGRLAPVSSLADRFTGTSSAGEGVDGAVSQLAGAAAAGAPAETPGAGLLETLLDAAFALEEPLLVLWLGLSAVFAARLALEWWRGRRRPWRRAEIEGREVLVAADEGPALAGVLRPEIVVPGWFVELPSDLRELALRHEEEHRDARDPWLVLASELTRALLPWNAGVHWAARRLRRAAELDCDRRLLREGADRGAYGRLLVTVGSRSTDRTPMRKVALTERTSDLKRRITMLRSRERDRWTGLRAAGAAVLAVAAVGVACEAPVPPVPEAADEADAVAGDSVAGTVSAKEAVRGSILTADGTLSFDSPDAPLLVVDGVIMSDPPELDPAEIAAIEVIKGNDARAKYGERAANGVIQIHTRERERAVYERLDEEAAARREAREPGSPESWKVRSFALIGTEPGSLEFRDHDGSLRVDAAPVSTGESPLVVVDGVILGRDVAPERINALDIEMIEVVEGEAARALYGERARDGLIRITTKDGG